jgi:hypothetical protein
MSILMQSATTKPYYRTNETCVSLISLSEKNKGKGQSWDDTCSKGYNHNTVELHACR